MRLSLLYSLCACALAASLPLASSAQWTDQTSFAGSCLTAVAGGAPVCGNGYGLFYYSSSDGMLGKLTKVNHLSSSGISAIAADGDLLAVGYSDGDIDLVDMSELSTVNIPELRLSDSFTQKRINGMAAYGGMLYLAFDGGVAEVDLRKCEIRSAWRIASGGVAANGVCVSDGMIYVATSAGLYRADLSSRVLEDYGQWTLLPAPAGGVASVVAFAGGVVAAVGEVGGECSLWRLTGSVAEMVTTVSSFRGLDASASRLAVVSSGRVDVFDSAFGRVASISSVRDSQGAYVVSSPSFRSASFMTDGSLAIADVNAGLVVSSLSSVGRSWLPQGPASAVASDVFSFDGDVYVGGQGRSASYGAQGNVTSFSVLHDDEWASCRAASYAEGRDPVFFAADPVTRQVYLSTFGTGVFEVDGCALGRNYSSGNSSLSPAFSDYVLTDAMVVDEDQNLIVMNSSVSSGVNVMNKDGEWFSYSYGPMSGGHSSLGMVAASNGNIWVWSSRMNKPYTCVFNLNGTPETPDDDVFMTTLGTGAETQDNCVGSFSLVDAGSGETVGTRSTAVAVSADGSIWVGTTAGILVTRDNSKMLKTGSVTFNRIKVPRTDGSGLADYLLDGQFINDIKVDGADRKWIATDNGVYLVSADGLSTIHHFTASNSPLPSNLVERVAIRQTDGEVFFSTSQGLVSYRGDAVAPASKLSKVRIYPNPVSATASAAGYVSMTGFEDSSPVFITDAAGRRVFRTTSLGGMARWDLRREGGGRVANGVYIVWASDADGKNSAVGKILVTE